MMNYTCMHRDACKSKQVLLMDSKPQWE